MSNLIATSHRLTPDQLEMLKAAAMEDQVDQSTLVRDAIQLWIDRRRLLKAADRAYRESGFDSTLAMQAIRG